MMSHNTFFYPPSREYQWFWIFPPDEDIFPAVSPCPFFPTVHIWNIPLSRFSAGPLPRCISAGSLARFDIFFLLLPGGITILFSNWLMKYPHIWNTLPSCISIGPLLRCISADRSTRYIFFYRRISLTFEIPTPYLRNLLIFFWLFSVEVPAHLKYPFPSCISGGPLPSCISAGSRPTRFDIYFFLLPNGNYYFPLNYLYIWKYPPQYLRWPALRWPAPHFFILPFCPSFYRNLLGA